MVIHGRASTRKRSSQFGPDQGVEQPETNVPVLDGTLHAFAEHDVECVSQRSSAGKIYLSLRSDWNFQAT